MKMNEFVRAVRLSLDLTQEEFGELFKNSKANVSAWEKGRHEPSMAQALKMFEMGGKKIPLPYSSNVFTNQDTSIKLPLLCFQEVALMFGNESGLTKLDEPEYTTTNTPVSGSAFAVVLEGASMQPDFRSGDEVIIDTEISPSAGDFVLARHGQIVVFRKFQDRGQGEDGEHIFELIPTNPDFAPMHSRSGVLILGVAVEFRRRFSRR